jgi:hypothetical protein
MLKVCKRRAERAHSTGVSFSFRQSATRLQRKTTLLLRSTSTRAPIGMQATLEGSTFCRRTARCCPRQNEHAHRDPLVKPNQMNLNLHLHLRVHQSWLLMTNGSSRRRRQPPHHLKSLSMWSSLKVVHCRRQSPEWSLRVRSVVLPQPASSRRCRRLAIARRRFAERARAQHSFHRDRAINNEQTTYFNCASERCPLRSRPSTRMCR